MWCGLKLGSKDLKVRIETNRRLGSLEKIRLTCGLAGLDNDDFVFVVFHGELEPGDFTTGSTIYCDIPVQTSRESWTIAYSDDGFARIKTSYIEHVQPSGTDLEVYVSALAAVGPSGAEVQSAPLLIAEGDDNLFVVGR